MKKTNKEVMNESIDRQLNDKQVISDKSDAKLFDTNTEIIVTNIAFNTQSVNNCQTSSSSSSNSDYTDCDNSVDNTNNTLLSDSRLHRLIPYAKMTAKEKQIINENNLKVIKGKLSKHELEILTGNWDKFCEDYKCDEDMKTRLLGYFALTNRYTRKQRKDFQYFMRSSQFLMRLANGLPNRTILQIYQTARVKFHSLKYLRDLSMDMRDKVKSLHSVYGNKWTEIGERVTSTPNSVYCYFRLNFNKNGEPFDTGKWTLDEDLRLLAAFKRVLNTDDLKQHIYTKQLPFKQIGDLAEINRSLTQIEKHWHQYLRWQLAQWDQLVDSWSQTDTARLIYCLFKYNFTDESDIDWDIIKEKFANISSFNSLMRNWRLISQTVPSVDCKSYKQIIDFLYDNYLPKYIKSDDELKEFEMFFNS
ncbi:cyclin-D-binding Myb-like transcription factor 1 [Oppia nitens]|uniref:cyclin-D-binding Myb-like transcription factor 1 n=1 Tax=Oppia nitens TaxID=1686743 RepID=UPI0023DB2F35|nr:cyclin-D-binding Myb-like transcription factor 1 [Oppia nitens]